MVQLMAPFRSSTSVDPGWEHGIAQDDRKKKVKCNYCGKIVSGGIYRLKQHLARVSGEVTYCDKAPEDVYRKMKQNLEGSRSSRKPRAPEDEEQAYLNLHYEDDDDLPAPAASCPVGSRRTKGKQLMANDRSLMVDFIPVRLGYVDPGWEHGVAQDDRKKKVKCNYCDKVVSGGINRFKQHLAKIPGEVASCKNAPEEVYLKMKENMKWHRTGRRQRQLDSNEISDFCKQTDEEEEGEHEQGQDEFFHSSKDRSTVGEKRLRKDWKMEFRGISPVGGSEAFQKKSRLDSVFCNTPNSQLPPSRRQLKVKNGWSRRSRRDVVSSICNFFYQAGVPPEAANSQQFHKMLEVVSQYGHGLVGPRSQVISGRFLQEEIAIVKKHLLEYKVSWAITGCSILADSWIDAEGRALINLLVSCPRGVYFVASVDGTDIVEDALSLYRVLDKVVEEMGEGNVVQVITDNTPSFKTAGKMLEERRSNLFWTPCATYCIDRMLDDFSRINSVQECIVKGQKITKLIYNRIWLLNLMKEFTQGQELLRIGATRCASSFATLQCLLDFRTSIRKMLQSSKWISSGISQTDEGKEVEKIVSNATFWKKVQCACRTVEPVIQVLQKVHSGENPSIAFIYNDMLMAKLAIKSIHGDDACKYGPFWSVLDNHWNSLSHHPLYLAAYFLNPSFRYCSDFMVHSEMVRGLNDCIIRLEPDNLRRISASRQIPDYNSAKGDFGTELAISTRTALDPAAWWQQHGISCLELQRIAVRILSQTCSSFGCEHWWSIYDKVHIRRQNRIAQKKLDDLIFVHYNMRLREWQTRRSTNDSISVDSLLAEHLLRDWIVVEPGRRGVVLQDDEGMESGTGHEDGDENDMMDYDGLEGEKTIHEAVSRSCEGNGDVNPPSYDAGCGGSGSGRTEDGEEEDDNFLNEDLSEEIEN
ncbi:hypothetical protein LINPERHAP1_LOCUS24614 [Linum perenne]